MGAKGREMRGKRRTEQRSRFPYKADDHDTVLVDDKLGSEKSERLHR